MAINFIVYITIVALGVIAGAIRFRKLNKSSKYIFILLIVTLLIEIIAWVSGKIYHKNLIVYRVFLFIQYILIAIAFMKELIRYRRIIIISVYTVMVMGLVDFVMNRQLLFQEYPTLLKTFCNILIVVWVLLYLRNLLTVPLPDSFTEYSLFWVSVGLLLFLTTNIVSFSAMNYINTYRLESFFSELRRVSNLVLYSLISVSFLTKQRSLLQ